MFTKWIPLTLISPEVCKCKNVLLIPNLLPTDEGLEGGTAEQLSASLARASPELRKCVASCKRIAETTRLQNNFQNVSSLFPSLRHTFLTLTLTLTLQL